jgi:catechol 2,3-dioxygenase-like lactoylglutathione lyase family enzyme
VSQPTLRVTSVTIGTPDPLGLAAFYARLLGRSVTAEHGPRPGEPELAGWAQIRTAGEVTLSFEHEAQWTEPIWPSEPGRQHPTEHLDIAVSDLDAAVAHAVDAGARPAPVQPQDAVRVMLDPDGHPFCLFRSS